MNALALETEGISKSLPDMKTLDNVSLRMRPGTVHALMGENGAGKSTLVKCLIGIYRPGRGSIRVKRKPMESTDTIDTLRSGISMIHQELNLVPHMMMVENIRLGCGPMKYGLVDHDQLTHQTQAPLDKLNIRLTADRLVDDLSITAQRVVEIAKAVSWNAGTVIMDEPTSALTEGEVAHLLTIIRDLRAQSRTIIHISRKVDEVFAITDEINAFRGGTWVGSKNTTEFTRQSLITQMAGCELAQLLPKFNNTIGEEVLTARNLTRHGVLHDASFTVRHGEILGVIGLVGAGHNEVMKNSFGMERFSNGEVLIDGALVTIDPLSVAIEKGVVLLTKGRKKSDPFLVLSVLENISIVKMPEYISKSGFAQHMKMAEDCMEQIRWLNTKTPTMDQTINNLSGGSQQKILIARWLLVQPKILILDEPTHGINAGAKTEIYHLISELANWGVAVTMVSSEPPEILGMSDRIMMMHEGRITDILEKDKADQETISSLASH